MYACLYDQYDVFDLLLASEFDVFTEDETSIFDEENNKSYKLPAASSILQILILKNNTDMLNDLLGKEEVNDLMGHVNSFQQTALMLAIISNTEAGWSYAHFGPALAAEIALVSEDQMTVLHVSGFFGRLRYCKFFKLMAAKVFEDVDEIDPRSEDEISKALVEMTQKLDANELNIVEVSEEEANLASLLTTEDERAECTQIMRQLFQQYGQGTQVSMYGSGYGSGYGSVQFTQYAPSITSFQ